MDRAGNILRQARSEARLTEALMASLVGLEEARLRQLEASEAEPSPDELDSYAQVFGLRLREFLQGGADHAPITKLFLRSSSEAGQEGLRRLVAEDAHWTLGEFMQCVRDVDELLTMLEVPKAQSLPAVPKELAGKLSEKPPYGGDKIAEWLRNELGLGVRPIDSMKNLVAGLGVDVFWVTPEVLTHSVDGASTDEPRNAILVNLVEGGERWWRTRMTLGHELCHLLCQDSEGGKHFALFSPHLRREDQSQWNLFEGFDRIEKRASAFAACLLAPDAAVQEAVGSYDPTSENAIIKIGETFGLGRTVAINRLQHIFALSPQMRKSMAARSAPQHWLSEKHPDIVRESIGLRSGKLETLALRAYAEGRIDALRVREYLRLPLTEPLPEHTKLSAKQREPLRHAQDRVRSIAQRYLLSIGADDWELLVLALAPAEGGWHVKVGRRKAESELQPIPCGELVVSYDLSSVAQRLDLGVLEAG